MDLDRGLFVILLEDLQNREAETKCMSQVRGAERARRSPPGGLTPWLPFARTGERHGR